MFISHKNLLNWITSEDAAKMTNNDIKSYIKGAFIACGSVSGVNENGKKSVDYHLEWVFTSMQKAENFIKYLSQINKCCQSSAVIMSRHAEASLKPKLPVTVTRLPSAGR